MNEYKYNIGDEVFYVYEGRIVRGKVFSRVRRIVTENSGFTYVKDSYSVDDMVFEDKQLLSCADDILDQVVEKVSVAGGRHSYRQIGNDWYKKVVS